MQVQSLVGELRSYMPCGEAKTKTKTKTEDEARLVTCEKEMEQLR